MTVRFHWLADRELSEAFAYYEKDYPERGYRFLEKVREAIARVVFMPAIGTEEIPGYRKIVVNRFSYKLIYSFEDGEIIIWVVAHGHRMPRYWQRRLDSGGTK